MKFLGYKSIFGNYFPLCQNSFHCVLIQSYTLSLDCPLLVRNNIFHYASYNTYMNSRGNHWCLRKVDGASACWHCLQNKICNFVIIKEKATPLLEIPVTRSELIKNTNKGIPSLYTYLWNSTCHYWLRKCICIPNIDHNTQLLMLSNIAAVTDESYILPKNLMLSELQPPLIHQIHTCT